MNFDPLDLFGPDSDSSDIWQHRMLQYECTKYKMTDTNWLVLNGYIFFAVLLLASIATWLRSKKEKQDRLMPLVFFFFSVSLALLPAIGRQNLTAETKAANNFIRWLISPAMSLSNMMYNYVGVRSTTGKLCARDTWAVLHVLLIILIVAGDLYPLAALVTLIVMTFMLLVYLWQAIKKNRLVALKFIGLGTVYSSLFLTLAWSEVCDAEGFKTCFSECPLPQPLSFTYLDVAQLMGIGGFIILAIGEAIVPASSLYIPLLLPGAGRQDSVNNQQNSRVLAAVLPQDNTALATVVAVDAANANSEAAQTSKKGSSEGKEDAFNDNNGDVEKGTSE